MVYHITLFGCYHTSLILAEEKFSCMKWKRNQDTNIVSFFSAVVNCVKWRQSCAHTVLFVLIFNMVKGFESESLLRWVEFFYFFHCYGKKFCHFFLFLYLADSIRNVFGSHLLPGYTLPLPLLFKIFTSFSPPTPLLLLWPPLLSILSQSKVWIHPHE